MADPTDDPQHVLWKHLDAAEAMLERIEAKPLGTDEQIKVAMLHTVLAVLYKSLAGGL